jgi:hypothetical protein
MRIGRWNGRDYSGADLDAMVAAYNALRGVYDPPAKLGHNSEQQLLASDGLPAAGWVSNLYRRGERLVADFKDVPKKVAELIKAGAYKKRSAEIWFNAEFGERTYRTVLKAVSWLGADAPAVSGLSDVFEMYTDPMPQHAVIVATLSDAAPPDAKLATPEPSFDTIRSAVYDALCEAYPYIWQYDDFGNPITPTGDHDGPSPSIRDVYTDSVIVNDQDYDGFWRIPYTYKDSGEVELGTPEKVAIQYVSIPETTEAQNSKKAAKNKKSLKDRILADFDSMVGQVQTAGAGKKGVGTLRTFLKDARKKISEMGIDENTEESKNTQEETMTDKEIRELLGLAEDADIKQELLKLKATHVELSEHESLKKEVAELKQAGAQRDANDLVQAALRDGKLAPAQVEWATNLCLKDRESFEAYVSAAPKVVDFAEHGSGSETTPAANVSDTAKKIGTEFGISEERLADNRPLSEKLAERKQAVATAGKAS